MTVGHGAILHACTIEDEVLIGMGAKVLDGALIRQGAIVAAGSVVAPGTEVPSGQVWMGTPARYMRDVDPAESSFLGLSAHNYAELAKGHWNESTKVYLVRPHCAAFSVNTTASKCQIQKAVHIKLHRPWHEQGARARSTQCVGTAVVCVCVVSERKISNDWLRSSMLVWRGKIVKLMCS